MICAICGSPVESTERLSQDIQAISFYECLCAACAASMIAEPSVIMALTVEADFRLMMIDHVHAIATELVALTG